MVYCECEYSELENHNYNIAVYPTSEGHQLQCLCGAVSSTVEAHSNDRCEIKDMYSHNVYCRCGYLISEDYHNMVKISIRFSKCSDCGYIRDNDNFGEIIKGIDDETPHLTE